MHRNSAVGTPTTSTATSPPGPGEGPREWDNRELGRRLDVNSEVKFTVDGRTTSARANGRSHWLLLPAALWSVGLVVAALLVPVYDTGASQPGRSASSVSTTLVQMNGMRVLIPVGVPLAVVGLVAAALRHRRSRGKQGAGVPAWILGGLLGLLALVGMLTIGIFVLPVAVVVIVVCASA